MAPFSVVLGITGGIAAYKSAEIVSRLRRRGVEVYVVMTDHAARFVTPLTMETLSGHPAALDLFDRGVPWEVGHIALARRADVFAIAPATADIIGKMASGIADDMLSTAVMATRAPVLLAPAMNAGMYLNPAVQDNIARLRQRGVLFVGPGEGPLACGDTGPGRMSEPETVVERIMALLEKRGDLAGLRVLVTAGPTREPLDPVRFLTNRSSGKMGYAVAEAARIRGAKVTLVSGPVSLAPPEGVEVVPVQTAREMLDAVVSRFGDCDIAVKAAAPADFRPSRYEELKIKKNGGERTLALAPNPDIAAEMGRRKKDQTLVIFAAETGDPLEAAREKLMSKNADLVAANDVTAPGAGFDTDTNVVTLIAREGEPERLPLLTKREAAGRILDAALAICREKHSPGGS